MKYKDQYLNPSLSLTRLINEYSKHGSLVIGFDFDGTVYDFHQTGAYHEEVKQLLRNLKAINCKLICWTAQKDLPFVEQFLKDENIPFDGINSNGIDLGYESRKPFFSALLDDRAGLLQVFEELSFLVHIVQAEDEIKDFDTYDPNSTTFSVD